MTLIKIPVTLLLIVLIILAVAYAAAGATLDAKSSNHADRKHGWLLAQSIVDCIAKNGTYMGMKFRDKDGKFYLPCQLSDGRIGLGIFDSAGNNISAFVPRDGIWQNVRDYILQRAFRYNGPLPW